MERSAAKKKKKKKKTSSAAALHHFQSTFRLFGERGELRGLGEGTDIPLVISTNNSDSSLKIVFLLFSLIDLIARTPTSKPWEVA